MKVVIIGGGIGGVTAALALLRLGIDVEVHERVPAAREVGAGIVLWGNAMAALRTIGVADVVAARGEPMRLGELRSADGRVLSSQQVDQWDRELGERSIVLHRAALLEALHAALPRGVLRFGRECTAVVSASTVATARFRDGSESTAAVVVGADGIDSAARRCLLPDESPPRYAGVTCDRAVVEWRDDSVPPGYLNETWGRGPRFGLLRLSPTHVYWFATVHAPRGERDATPAAARARLLRLFSGWWGPIPALIEATPDQALLRHDIVDRRPIRTWGRARITLLGDAAHPTTPNIGQGACLAIEDGLALAGELSCAGSEDALSEALRRYERIRQPRTAEITRFSWRLGQVAQWSGAWSCRLRDRLMALTPLGAIRRQHQRYVGHRVPSPSRGTTSG